MNQRMSMLGKSLFPRRLITAMSVFMFLSLGGLGVAIARSRAGPPAPPFASALCGRERPCFMGISPGETRWQDALNIVRRSGHEILDEEELLVSFYIEDVTLRYDRLVVIVNGDFSVQNRQPIVSNIYVESEGDASRMPEIGLLVGRYGPPCGVIIWNEWFVELHYPYMLVGVQAHDNRLYPTSEIRGIEIHADNRAGYCAGNVPPLEGGWHGFIRVGKYRMLTGD
jgi:hypothetical protein